MLPHQGWQSTTLSTAKDTLSKGPLSVYSSDTPSRDQGEAERMSTYVKSPCDESVIRSAPDRPPCTPNVGLWVLIATILGSSMAFIDGTVVNVALPVLQVQLNATTADAQWVIEAY